MPDKLRSIPVTDEEDREITEAALADPNNPPLTDEELAAMRAAPSPSPAATIASPRFMKGSSSHKATPICASRSPPGAVAR
jgi:hypothetical protein